MELLNYQIYETGIDKHPAEQYTDVAVGVFNDRLYRVGNGLGLVEKTPNGIYLFFLDAPSFKDADILLKKIIADEKERPIYVYTSSQIGRELFISNLFIYNREQGRYILGR